jgi:hypothetical protein
MRREWGAIVGNLTGDSIGELRSFKRPTGLSTLDNFNEMIIHMGFILDDPEEVA